MPRICMWDNVIIYMYWFDHNPPHIHVEYHGVMCVIAIESATITEGRLPNRVKRQVLQWVQERQDELLNNWSNAQAGIPLVWIEP
jgi:hypothetical protein